MSGDWNEQLERRADGLVPGYVGANDQAAPAAAITGNLEMIVSGLAADRPAANAFKGWYFSTDTQALEHSDGATWEAVQSGTSGAGIPIADATCTVDSTTYDNTVTGVGKLTTLIINPNVDTGDAPALAIAAAGDAFPRYLITQYGIFLSDGTFDPYNNGSSIYGLPGTEAVGWGDIAIHGHGSTVHVDNGLVLNALPNADPHIVGALWNNAGAVHISAG